MNRKNTLLTLKKKEREDRINIIIHAAREVFGKKTYDQVSMAQIAKTAGIAKSSIYTYFDTQEEMYARIACQDSLVFIRGLETCIRESGENTVRAAIDYFLDYYIENEAQWRMITHFALHGNKDMKSVEILNDIGRQLMNLFDSLFIKLGMTQDIRLLSHTLFSSLSGILIAYRNYPGRSEIERMNHMKQVAAMLEQMISALIRQSTKKEK